MARRTDRRDIKAKSKAHPSPKVGSLRDLFLEELRDLYNAEQQLTRALPKMAAAATSSDLRSAFEHHLKETYVHVDRLDRIAQSLGFSSKGKKCRGMEGLVEEGAELIREDMEDMLKDAGLIGAAQRVEHYEMAGYGTVRAFAERLAETDVVRLLQQTLDEEKCADMKLTEIGKRVNMEVEDAGYNDEGDGERKEYSRAKGSTRHRKGQGR